MSHTMSDDINKLDAIWIGQFCRLEIPLQSTMNLRRVAEELRGLAFRLDGISRYEPDATQAMLDVRSAVRRCNKRIEAIRGRGRPKKSRNYF